VRTFDLNNPQDARDWLAIWEERGLLTYDDHETSLTLTDERAVAVAKELFMKAKSYEPEGKVQ
jgi:hypothetical protein